jgi:hypothetical protein
LFLDSAAYSGFAQDDTRFARRLLIDKNLEIQSTLSIMNVHRLELLFRCKTRDDDGVVGQTILRGTGDQNANANAADEERKAPLK